MAGKHTWKAQCLKLKHTTRSCVIKYSGKKKVCGHLEFHLTIMQLLEPINCHHIILERCTRNSSQPAKRQNAVSKCAQTACTFMYKHR